MGRADKVVDDGHSALAAIRQASEDDLAQLDRDAVARHVRTLARLIAHRHPGHVVELRIPPFAAVQLGFADTTASHRRGTPPHVVEMDAMTFLALCVGTLTWERAMRAARISASGTRSDLSGIFPLTDPRLSGADTAS